jgi:hypothetical protein
MQHIYFQLPILLLMGNVSWVAWILLLSFLKMLSVLSSSRLDVLLATAPAPNARQCSLLVLLFVLQSCACGAFVYIGQGVIVEEAGPSLRTSHLIILLYDVVLQSLGTAKCCWRFGMQCMENCSDALWERFGQKQCMLDLILALVSSSLVLFRVVHLWWLTREAWGVVDILLLVNTKMACQGFATRYFSLGGNILLKDACSLVKYSDPPFPLPVVQPMPHPQPLPPSSSLNLSLTFTPHPHLNPQA